MTDKFKKKYKDKLQKALAECETGKQANLIYEVVNVLIDYITYKEKTVADIREYIDEEIKQCETFLKVFCHNEVPNRENTIRGYCTDSRRKAFEEIRSMLDELEERPKAHWEEQDNEEEVIHYRCSNCGNFSEYGLESYCPNCEARMDRR